MRFSRLIIQAIIFFSVFLALFCFTLFYQDWGGVIVMGFILLLGVLVILFPDASADDDVDEIIYHETPHHPQHTPGYLLYPGNQLKFGDEELKTILSRYLFYFRRLNSEHQLKFILRLKKFIAEKTFLIHDKSGFREMPILISGAAVQLSFGFDNYLLPDLGNVNIFPEEYVESSHILEGNVAGNNINISWKYFLDGFKLPEDGKNVGLHEMAHAYYYQNFGPFAEKDKRFIQAFNNFQETGKIVFDRIKEEPGLVYNDYALRNFQEFWAQTVEIFFERPVELNLYYSELYQSVSAVLNQDVLNNIN